MTQPFLGRQLDRSVDLALVDGDADYFAPDQLRDLPGWRPNAASHIEHLHARSEPCEKRQSMLIEDLRGLQRVMRCEGSVVEMCAPVSFGCVAEELVVPACHRGGVSFSASSPFSQQQMLGNILIC